jgi:hypothetical protein
LIFSFCQGVSPTAIDSRLANSENLACMKLDLQAGCIYTKKKTWKGYADVDLSGRGYKLLETFLIVVEGNLYAIEIFTGNLNFLFR